MVTLSALKLKKGDNIKFRKLNFPLSVIYKGKNIISLKGIKGGDYSIVQNEKTKKFILIGSNGSKLFTFDGKSFNLLK